MPKVGSRGLYPMRLSSKLPTASRTITALNEFRWGQPKFEVVAINGWPSLVHNHGQWACYDYSSTIRLLFRPNLFTLLIQYISPFPHLSNYIHHYSILISFSQSASSDPIGFSQNATLAYLPLTNHLRNRLCQSCTCRVCHQAVC